MSACRPAGVRRLVRASLVVAGLVLTACAARADLPAGSGPPAGNPLPSSASGAAQERSTDDALACVARIPRDVRIGQTMLVTTTDVPRVQQWLDEGHVAGLLANGRLTHESAAALDVATTGGRYGALLAADEEGGGVQRYRDVTGPIPSPQRQALEMSPEQVRDLHRTHGQRLSDWGVDMVLAPVVDVGHGPGIGSRSYSDDPVVVTQYATAAALGLADAGLLPVLKHFPGHGRTTGDSHDAPVAGPGIDELRAVDLVPFREVPRAVDVAVMVGHTTVPGYAPNPGSQSPETIGELLVGELGFTGPILSDALGMAAAGMPSQGDALVGFIRAGGDLGIIGPGGSVEGRRAMRAALADGTLPEQRLNEAAATVLALKGIDPCRVAGGPTREVDDTAGGSDPPVENPTEETDPVG